METNKELFLSCCDQLFQWSLLVRQMSQLAIREALDPTKGATTPHPSSLQPNSLSLSLSQASSTPQTHQHHAHLNAITSHPITMSNPTQSLPQPTTTTPPHPPPPPLRTPPAHPHLPRHPRPPPPLADLAPFPAPNPRSAAALFPPRPRFCDPEP
jgi:hypothetical protein